MKKISLVLAVLTGGALLAFSGTASAEKGYKKVPSSAMHHLNRSAKQAKRTKWRIPSRPKVKYEKQKAKNPCQLPNPPASCFMNNKVYKKWHVHKPWSGSWAHRVRGNMTRIKKMKLK
jgi:hypothetical protein